MKITTSIVILGLAVTASAAPRSSANYALAAEVLDAGGQRATSARYVNDGSAASFSTSATANAGTQTARAGYIGQLYDLRSLAVTAAAPMVNENATLQLGAWLIFDDASLLPLTADAVTWSVAAGPLTSISTTGVATAATVYADAGATARADFGQYAATLAFTVRNVNTDDLGLYAGDGLPDEWQVQYFGLANPLAAPTADPTGTGQTNAFKYIAGLNPTDPAARFTVDVQTVAGDDDQFRIVFQPCVAGRTYVVEAGDEPDAFAPLSGTVAITGTTGTFTDTTTLPRRFYHVRILKP